MLEYVYQGLGHYVNMKMQAHCDQLLNVQQKSSFQVNTANESHQWPELPMFED